MVELWIKKKVVGEEIRNGGGRYTANYNMMVRLGLLQKVMFSHIYEGGEGVSCQAIWEKSVSRKGNSQSKAACERMRHARETAKKPVGLGCQQASGRI